MKLLNSIIKGAASPKRAVEKARVVEVRTGRARLATSQGEIWTRCALSVTAGNWVTVARMDGELQVLALARAPRQQTKIVRV
jgi:hypothetical protein